MAERNPSGRLERLVLNLLRLVPVSVRRTLFVGLSLCYYHLAPRRRLIAIYNLTRAFPEKTAAEVRGIARGVYRNMALVAAEFFDLPALTRETLKDAVEVEGIEGCQRALAKGRGVLLFGAHFGNWELQAAAASLLLGPLTVIYRPLDNAFLDRLVLAVRSATGNIPLPKQHAMRRMLRTLREGGMVGLLIDQNWSRKEGVFVDFFGRPACTTEGLALLALHTGAPVVPAFMVRRGDGRYRLVFGPEMEVTATGDREADVRRNTQNFTAVLEEMIRRYPSQWLWVHQRWKTRPPLAGKVGEAGGEGGGAAP